MRNRWSGYAYPLGLALLGSAICAMPLSAQEAAHVHGEALLTVAVDGAKIELELDIPTDSLWGFEYTAKTAEEKRRVAAVKKQLEASISVVRWPAAAACEQRSVSWQQQQELAHDHHHEHEHAKHDEAAHAADDEHQNALITYQFTCANMEQLKNIDVTLFDNFSALQRLRVQWVDSQRQLEKQLNPQLKSFSLD